jgi:hypothetical protein
LGWTAEHIGRWAYVNPPLIAPPLP